MNNFEVHLKNRLHREKVENFYVQCSKAYTRLSPLAHQAAFNDAELAVSLATKRAKRELIAESQLRRAVTLFSLERYGDAKHLFIGELWFPEASCKENGSLQWLVLVQEITQQPKATLMLKTSISSSKTHLSKRASMTLIYNAPPPLDEHKALPTKRHRLTRDYEKHDFDEETTIAIEKEGREGEE